MTSSSNSSKQQRPPPSRRDFSSTTVRHDKKRQREPLPPPPSSSSSSTNPNRPTHFLALPIGHHVELRNAVDSLTSSWLAHEPPIDGLDPSIVINPRRLHLTLGAIALNTTTTAAPSSTSGAAPYDDPRGPLDLTAATELLVSLAPRIRGLLAHHPLRVSLGRLAIMQPDPTRAHVLYAEPDVHSTDGIRLRAVCELVHSAFKQAGFLTDARRPLKLHCTILNTTYRRPSPGQRRPPGRIPFSFATFPPDSKDGGTLSNLGTWTVDEVQICKMGSWAPDGAYVRVAGCDLRSMSIGLD
ncbi:AKAP7 2'5' RNA ligase-like domain-containing protein [Multifurca ochricompacta]|uniref:AKAP7 2'5' RNA ligase-like domain-containing protein n=1 Tax=Multifurca ochricompacta TaxID=376703 RepID=A0AAD4QJ22_9AGAM|nr:AKAP7 2'5' RNA ligase-like domain-containing protein [Multifurca ochricompacta]